MYLVVRVAKNPFTMMTHYGHKLYLVDGPQENIKILKLRHQTIFTQCVRYLTLAKMLKFTDWMTKMSENVLLEDFNTI